MSAWPGCSSLSATATGSRGTAPGMRSERRCGRCWPTSPYPQLRPPDRATSDADRSLVQAAVRGAQQANPSMDPQFLHWIGDVLLLQWPGQAEVEFALAFAQLSAPTMAKGSEDTAFYRYNRLVSLNEVGGDPGRSAARWRTSTRAALHRGQLAGCHAHPGDPRHQAQPRRASPHQRSERHTGPVGSGHCRVDGHDRPPCRRRPA